MSVEQTEIIETKGLKGRTAIVTGGGKGIGRAIAICLAEEGVNVVVTSRTFSEINMVSKRILELGVDSLAIEADVSSENDVKHLIQETVNRWGSIHILVNNAAIFGRSYVIDLDKALWDRILASNLTGAFLCCREVLPYMVKQKWGRIVNISSSYGKMPSVGNSAYNTSKFGLISFTRCLALEVAEENITVNSICPGWVETERLWSSIEAKSKQMGESIETLVKRFKRESPQNRWINPREIGRLVSYLASDDASSITGEDINITGGMVMY
jgi:2-hydroxycyclohexanecarboxyl-CoA dehydrogenase